MILEAKKRHIERELVSILDILAEGVGRQYGVVVECELTVKIKDKEVE